MMELPASLDDLDPPFERERFRLTEKQRIGVQCIGSDATHILLYGGSRSGKTFLAVRAVIFRALWSAGSRHLIARFRFAHIVSSIVADTWPKVMALCYPGVPVVHHKSEHYFEFANGSQVWYGGLDDKDRTEKILGMEFATILLEECSQIPWASREVLITRLAQKTGHLDGKPLRLKALYCENPPVKSHWTYTLFIEKRSPDTRKGLAAPLDYIALQLNPRDNAGNISPKYLELLDGLGERQRKRFRDGQFGEAGEAALWSYELIEQQRLDYEPDINDFIRTVVAVDPSGAASAEDAARDQIGIVVAALKADGSCVILEDATFLGSPKEWGELAVRRAEAWGADVIVGEQNYGGAMVQFVIQSACTSLGIIKKIALVTASKGKHVRAEPISALYEQQKVWHVAGLNLLEDELCQMTTYGYTGDRSPNRADAAIWAVSYLFPAAMKAARSGDSGRGRPPTVNLGYAAQKRRR